jgi:hypothetical protein
VQNSAASHVIHVENSSGQNLLHFPLSLNFSLHFDSFISTYWAILLLPGTLKLTGVIAMWVAHIDLYHTLVLGLYKHFILQGPLLLRIEAHC